MSGMTMLCSAELLKVVHFVGSISEFDVVTCFAGIVNCSSDFPVSHM